MTGVAAAVLAGGSLGLLYFGGLWLTVRRVPAARRPALLVAASFLGRLAAAGGGFGILAARGPLALAAALAAFLGVRLVLVRRLGPGSAGGGAPAGRAPEA